MSPNPIVIGIIGPPCSGKSTIAQIVESQGGDWINADTIAKDQLIDPTVIGTLAEAFGPTILRDDGQLSRREIANLVFGDDAASADRLRLLGDVVHPRTKAIIADQLEAAKSAGVPFVILDVPLLIESGWDAQCDQVWCTEVPAQQHATLLKSRGWTSDELVRRQRRQLSAPVKRQRADWVIVNDCTLEVLRNRVIERLLVLDR